MATNYQLSGNEAVMGQPITRVAPNHGCVSKSLKVWYGMRGVALGGGGILHEYW